MTYLTRDTAYAELYADARKTAIETGRTPSRLAEDRRELLKALHDLLNWGRDHISPVHNPDAHTLLVAAHEAIAKATGTK